MPTENGNIFHKSQCPYCRGAIAEIKCNRLLNNVVEAFGKIQLEPGKVRKRTRPTYKHHRQHTTLTNNEVKEFAQCIIREGLLDGYDLEQTDILEDTKLNEAVMKLYRKWRVQSLRRNETVL
jgi:hypothetical protein